jgi:SHS2 domain-containing protein
METTINLTQEEFDIYMKVKSELATLKAARSDLFDVIRILEQRMDVVQADFKSTQESIDSKNHEFQQVIDAIATTYSLGPHTSFTISETPPYTIHIVG